MGRPSIAFTCRKAIHPIVSAVFVLHTEVVGDDDDGPIHICGTRCVSDNEVVDHCDVCNPLLHVQRRVVVVVTNSIVLNHKFIAPRDGCVCLRATGAESGFAGVRDEDCG